MTNQLETTPNGPQLYSSKDVVLTLAPGTDLENISLPDIDLDFKKKLEQTSDGNFINLSLKDIGGQKATSQICDIVDGNGVITFQKTRNINVFASQTYQLKILTDVKAQVFSDSNKDARGRGSKIITLPNVYILINKNKPKQGFIAAITK